MSATTAYAPDVERVTRPRRYASTLTDEAATEIPPLAQAEEDARRAWEAAVQARDLALARHHATGVEPRDLKPLTGTADKPEGMSLVNVSRAVKRGYELLDEGDAGEPTAGGE